MNPLFVVNPKSGGGRSGAAIHAMLDVARSALGALDVAYTEGPRHAVTLAREGREVVVAVGGDGSIHEVANGLLQARARGATQAKLGIIGQGTGGDLRKSLGLEHRLDRYLAVIAAGVSRPIDVGRFSYVDTLGAPAEAYFINILSVGMGGLVDTYVARTSKALGGTAAYFAASTRALIDSEVGTLRVAHRVPGGESTAERTLQSRTLAICNGQFFGSGMHVAPMASCEDGAFDVVDLGGAGRLRFAAVSSRMYGGTHLRAPEVSHFRCDKIRVELLGGADPARFCLDVDGEPLGRLPIEVELMPRALPILLPP